MRNVAKLLLIVPVALSAGCASHRYPAHVATVAPASEVVVVPAPVSDRPIVRVYPEPLTSTPAAPGVSFSEHQIADSIRAMFNADPDWRSLTDQVEVRVSDGNVLLRGTVANDAVRDRIEQKIRAIPGVTGIDNGLSALVR